MANPRTDPRLAIEAEEEVRVLDGKIADLSEKMESARTRRRPRN